MSGPAPVNWVVSGGAWFCALAAGWASSGLVPLVCCLVIAALALISTDPDHVPTHSHGLDGVPDGIPPVLAVGQKVHLGLAAGGAVSIVVLAALEAPSVVAIAVLLVVALVSWLRAAPAVLGRRHLRRLRRALLALEPAVLMPYAGRSAAPWQLAMWEPHVVASGRQVLIVNVHAKYLSTVLDASRISSPVIQLGSAGTADLRHVIVPSIRAAMYVQNARRNDDFLAFDALTHVWLGHGDSDKPTSATTSHERYDLVVVAGDAARDRYRRIEFDTTRATVVALGRPQTRGITPGPRAGAADRIVLYAPTWHGSDPASSLSSLDRGEQIVTGLIAGGATVWFRPHPLSYRWQSTRDHINRIRELLKAERGRSGRAHRFGQAIDELAMSDLANGTDALVSDVSGLVSDYLASDKPIAMIADRGTHEQFRERHPVADACYVVPPDLDGLDATIAQMLGRDPLADARRRMRRYVVGDLSGERAAESFTEFVRTLTGET